MGLIETARFPQLSLSDTQLMTIFDNVENVYQALGLNHKGEEAARLLSDPGLLAGTIKEAWFFGNQLDLNGTRPKNGLSLWPLQWLVVEALQKGLVLDLGETPPSDQCSLRQLLDGEEYPFWFSNEVSVNVWDITLLFGTETHKVEFQRGWQDSLGVSGKQRTIFDENSNLVDYKPSDSKRK
ncbi:hypothetical protein AA313_de0208303 [Arthrobotrys entomopaga]|nr:hypothetical protein AA313_de0208303 [Arthrobotrys entomopaga]